MINTELLRQKIKESGYRIYYIAKFLGLTYPGLQNKIEGKTEFKLNEIRKLNKILNLTKEELYAIFFAEVLT